VHSVLDAEGVTLSRGLQEPVERIDVLRLPHLHPVLLRHPDVVASFLVHLCQELLLGEREIQDARGFGLLVAA